MIVRATGAADHAIGGVHMIRSAPLFLAGIAMTATLVTGCSGTAPGDPDDPAPAESDPQQPVDGVGDTDCVVGRWALDVDNYRSQSESYLLGLGIPITEFDMLGGQTLTTTEDGLLAVDTNIRSTGVLVAGDVSVPISVITVESATAEWGWDATSPNGGLLEVAEWQVVETSTESEGADGFELAPPRFDGENQTLLVDCDAQNMLLQGGGPLSALFVRI